MNTLDIYVSFMYHLKADILCLPWFQPALVPPKWSSAEGTATDGVRQDSCPGAESVEFSTCDCLLKVQPVYIYNICHKYACVYTYIYRLYIYTIYLHIKIL